MTVGKTSSTSCCSKGSCASTTTATGADVTAGVVAAAGAVSEAAGVGASTVTDTDTATATGADASAPVELTSEQEIQALRNVHQFLSNFDRVPGFLSNKWAKALDAIAVVANSLIAKNAPVTSSDGASTEGGMDASGDSGSESVVTQ